MNITPISILIPFKKNNQSIHLWFQERKSNDELNGLLEFPGGKVEEGELPIKAAAREVLEEASIQLQISDLKLFKSMTYQYPNKTLSFFVYAYEDKEELFSLSGWREITLESLDAYKERIPAANMPIIKGFLSSF